MKQYKIVLKMIEDYETIVEANDSVTRLIVSLPIWILTSLMKPARVL